MVTTVKIEKNVDFSSSLDVRRKLALSLRVPAWRKLAVCIFKTFIDISTALDVTAEKG